MQLSEIRSLFLEAAGRYDLKDAGDNDETVSDIFFINSGVRYLDLKHKVQDNKRVHATTLSADTFTVEIENLRTVEAVHVEQSDYELTDLEYKPLAWLRGKYGDFSEVSSEDTPKYWSSYIRRLSPGLITQTEGDFDYGSYDILFDTTRKKKGIVALPPPSSDLLIKVEAIFMSKELSEATDVNWWTTNYPEVLIEAAYLALERFYRNATGYQTHRAIVEDMMSEVDSDDLEEMYHKYGGKIIG